MIVSPSDFLKASPTQKHWGKLVTGLQDIDLTKHTGYAFIGKWVKRDQKVSLSPGRFLIVAAQRKSNYQYVLVNGDGEKVDEVQKTELLSCAYTEKRIIEDRYVAAMNNTLYSYALYIYLQLTPLTQNVSSNPNARNIDLELLPD